MTVPPPPTDTKGVLDRLERHYLKPGPMPGGIFLREVGINGGFGSGQRADAVHIGFTSSSGRILTGHEVKVSRGDWLHELDQPHKADLWADACHAWYLVTPRDLIKPEEVPHGWGWMVPSTRTTTRMDVLVKAEVRSTHTPPWLIVRSIFARYDTLRAEAIRKERSDLAMAFRHQLEEARLEFQAKGAGHTNPHAERLNAILGKVTAALREGGSWETASDDEIVEVLADVVKARGAARSLRMEIRGLVNACRTLTEPFRHVYGDLAKIQSEAEGLVSS